ncbi:MAG: flagellar basal-body rod protein FlgG [Bradymonadales bacterium]|nr:MAG: flagellar basal-body rod protein FlgG [Bradymonadales bacterium]
MIKALFTAATGMEAQQTRISVISNNLANMTTTGFKQSRAVFQDLLYQTVSEPGAETANGVTQPSPFQIGSGVRVVSTPAVFTQGVLEQTGRNLDIAIEGDGFLEVELPNGTGYTRSGALAVNQNGDLVTQNGFLIQPGVGNLNGVTGLTIGVDGVVSGIPEGQSDITNLGQIQISTFSNPAGLKAIGRNLFMASEASGDAQAVNPGENNSGTLRQGFLEGSNVNVAEELINMVMAQRAFELNSKVIRTSDEILAATNQMR